MLDWSRIPKIDAHIHLMPPDVIAANQGFGDHFVDFGNVEDYQKLMARYQIEAAFIMPFNDPYMLSMDFQVRSVHENLLAMCGAGRELYAFADADLRNDIDQTLHELERIAQEEKILGVKIHPSNTGYPVDGMYYDRIFGWAEANHILTEVHAYPRTHIADDVCSPLRLRTVLQRHPGLRMSVAHLGGFQYEALYDLDAYFNISAILPELAGQYGLEKTNEILRRFGTDRLVFATDYPDSRSLKPEEIYDRYFAILGQMDFTQEEAEKICKYNALDMIGKTAL